MKIVIIGGSGLIGSKLTSRLRRLGHEVVVASPSTGVNTITGQGLGQSLENADVVVDVTNSPSFEDNAVMEFFQTSGRNLLAEEIKAGVKYHVALSVVGTGRVPENGYFRAKEAQENIIRKSGIPYSIVHATQFFEFLDAIIASSQQGEEVRLSPANFQPIAADDVVSALTDVVLGKPINGIIEIAGPEVVGLVDLAKRYLARKADTRQVKVDGQARYFGTILNDKTLVPADNARLGATTFETWMNAQREVSPNH